MRHRPSGFWIGVVLLIAVFAFAVDRTTGDETGPPYDDPLINKIAFVVFIGATLLFVALCGVALVRRISRRS